MKKLFKLFFTSIFLILIPLFQFRIYANTYDVNVGVVGYDETEITILNKEGSVNLFGSMPSPSQTIESFMWHYKFANEQSYIDASYGYEEILPIYAAYPGDIIATITEVKYQGSEEFVPVTCNTVTVHIIKAIYSLATTSTDNIFATGSNVSFEITANPDYEFQGYKYKLDDGTEVETTINTFTIEKITEGSHTISLTAYKYNNDWIDLPESSITCYIEVVNPTDMNMSIDNNNLLYNGNANITLLGEDNFNNAFNEGYIKIIKLLFGKEGEEFSTTSISSLSTDVKTILGNNYSSGTWTIKAISSNILSASYSFNSYVFKDNGVTFTINNPVEYTMIEEPSSSINKTSGQDAIFVSSADFSKFSSVEIDNQEIDSSNYTAESGSTKITLHASYLSTLSTGSHTITIVSNDGYVSTTFTIASSSPTPKPKVDVPNTGVDVIYSNNHSYLKISTLSLLTIGTYMVIKKRKD